MHPPPEDLASSRLEALAAARGASLVRAVVSVGETASTNDDAKRAARELGLGAVATAYVADAQTRGRGRGSNAWWSPPGENLYASFVLAPGLEAARLPPLALAVGLAARDALAPRLPAAALAIKWPNDVFADGRKIAGVLVESISLGDRPPVVVAGVGVNVRARAFPPELGARATSVAALGGTDLDRGALFVDLAIALEARVDEVARLGARAAARAIAGHDALLGRRVAIDGLVGRAEGIDDDGRLLVRDGAGDLHRVASGHVEPLDLA